MASSIQSAGGIHDHFCSCGPAPPVAMLTGSGCLLPCKHNHADLGASIQLFNRSRTINIRRNSVGKPLCFEIAGQLPLNVVYWNPVNPPRNHSRIAFALNGLSFRSSGWSAHPARSSPPSARLTASTFCSLLSGGSSVNSLAILKFTSASMRARLDIFLPLQPH
jgi:hypothetical protein